MTTTDKLEPVTIEDLANVTGGTYPSDPSTPDTGTAGLGTAPCRPGPVAPSPHVVWVQI